MKLIKSSTTLIAALACLGLTGAAMAQKEFEQNRDSFAQPGVPQGVMHHYVYTSKAGMFPGTVRDVWVYIPAKYDAAKPAALMVFQDGGGYVGRDGGYRLPNIVDNLIAKGEMPTTICIMANPGVVPPADDKTQLPRYNRSVEYDGMDDRNARFLIEELIPDATKRYKLNITTDPRGHAISGGSSGGIAAFTAAWERPDYFGKVLGFISSFTDLRGGHNYPSLIRKLERKPIRLYLEEAVNDQDIYSGSWPIGNTDVAAALAFAGYDHKFVTGPGGHDGRFASAIFPDAMRWLWRGGMTGSPEPGGTRQPLVNIALDESKPWNSVSGLPPVTAIAGSTTGNLMVAAANAVHVLGTDGKVTTKWEKTGTVKALSTVAGGSAYALTTGKSVVALQSDGTSKTLAKGLNGVSLAVRTDGSCYVLTDAGKLVLIGKDGKRRDVGSAVGTGASNIQLVPDQSLLVVFPDPKVGRYAASWSVAPDGTLSNMQTYFDVYIPYGQTGAGIVGTAVDRNGWLYGAGTIGIQILDQAGRVNAILASAKPKAVGQIAFAGKNGATLYQLIDGALYARETRAQGVNPDGPAVKPPGPRL